MGEQNNNLIENTLDFAILNTLAEESLNGDAIDRRLQRVRAVLEFAATRSGMPGPASTEAALRRLQEAGWLETVKPLGASSSERVYALTSEGRKQLEVERSRRESTLASFVESGTLHDSFRQFLRSSENQ